MLRYTLYIHQVIVLGLNHHATILCPLEHRVWAQKKGNKWQTVYVDACIVQEQQGFICVSNTIKAQDICLDTEQNIYHFEIHPNETPETTLMYIRNGCICMRTLCNFISINNTTVDIHSLSNTRICNSIKISGCNFNYSAPVTTHQLLQSNYASYHIISYRIVSYRIISYHIIPLLG